MSEFRVSAIIPAYNNAAYVADAVKSVLAQTYPPSEVIVVDDGSTDGTRLVLEPFRDLIRYIYQENRGEPAARNTGMRHASFDYIAFLDADDLWMPRKLELQKKYLEEHPNVPFIYTDASTFDENGVIDASIKVRYNLELPEGNIFRALFDETLFGSGSVVFHKRCVDKVGCFDEDFRIGSDYEMWLRIARHFEVGCVDEPLMMYRQHSSMSTRGLGRALCNGVPWEAAVVQKIVHLYPEILRELGESTVAKRISKPYARQAHIRFRLDDYKNARRLFRKAIGYWPGNWRYWPFYLATFVPAAQTVRFRKLYRGLRGSPAKKNARGTGAEAVS